MKRLLLALAAWAFCSAAAAATTADRSPITQGMWWDRTKSGHGFEIFNAAGELSIFWYTYDTNGSPIWYTAQGPVASAGSDFPLLRFHWTGTKSAYEVVGSLRLAIDNPESATISFTIGNAAGTWKVEPFRVSNAFNEVDHDGVWFDQAHPGWGLSVLEQGDVLGGALYYYASDGNPTWVAGFTQGSKTVQYAMYRGTCPTCAYAAPSGQPAGTLTFDFSGETSARLHSNLATAPAAGIGIDGAAITQLGRPASARPADRQLVPYDSADALKAYLVKGIANIPISCSCSSFSAAPPGSSIPFSATNVQEQGVDEADFVKTDGRFIYTFQFASAGSRQPIVRVAEIASGASGVTLRGTQALASGPSSPVASAGLMLAGTQLVSVTGTQPQVSVGNSGWMTSPAWMYGTTNVEILDARAAPALATTWRATLDGHPISTRRVGDRLYVTSRFVPSAPPGASPATYANTSPLSALLPTMRVNGGDAVPLLQNEVLAPPPAATTPMADFIIVTTIDLANPRVVQRIAVLGAAEAVYVSPANFYVAAGRRPMRSTAGFYIPVPNGGMDLTDIHQLAFTPQGLAFVGSGTVEGTLGSNLDKTPYRFSEYAGKLRVVTSSLTSVGWGTAANRNRLSILEASNVAPGMLKTLAVLPNAARPQALGAPNEELYATRYVGDKLYAVTFPKVTVNLPPVDPLYVVDLATPADPRIRGELVVPGYSDYLHPLDNGLLLGFGRQMTGGSASTLPVELGLQLSLFDVRDPDNPKVMQQVNIGMRGSTSALLNNPHAFSIVATGTDSVQVAFPAYITGGYPLSGSGDTASYPWLESSLMRYQVGTAPATAKIVEATRIVADAAPASSLSGGHAITNGRSILFANGAAIYVGDGAMWYQDAVGVKQGPF